MTVNRLQDTPHISVPSVRVGASLPSHITVTVEKLAGMYDIESSQKISIPVFEVSWERMRSRLQ